MKDTGSANTGGAVVTASGLLIIAATQQDHKFHAFDTKTGKLLWETVLPAAGTATPITYMVNGRQYVAITTSAARRGGNRPPPGAAPGQAAPPAQADDAPSAAATDATTSQLIVFALPKS
jgi:quinoprotein glucose dehydrogenase